jgi:hypothetical protein
MAPSVAEVEKPTQPTPIEAAKAAGKYLLAPDPVSVIHILPLYLHVD